MRTLFLGDLEAQYKICQYELGPHIVPTVDVVIQLGNVISCSYNARDKKELGRNEVTLAFVDTIDAKVIRIMGSNEVAALNFPEKWTNSTSNKYIRDGWLAENPDWLTAAENKGRLLTHGGMTYGEWLSIGKPDNAKEAANLLNEKYAHTLFQGDCFNVGSKPRMYANPIWANPIMELYPSWVLAPESCPFDQVLGGDSINNETNRAATSDKNNIMSHIDRASYRKFGSLAEIQGTIFRTIDVDLPSKVLPSLPLDKAFYIENG